MSQTPLHILEGGREITRNYKRANTAEVKREKTHLPGEEGGRSSPASGGS